jgi:EAL and modified HD-GYP domain-containing signal transduction protein
MDRTPKQHAPAGASTQEWEFAAHNIALVARQPIFDVHDNVPAYELLFRNPSMKSGLGETSAFAATATVLVDGFALIRPSLRPGQRLFINFTEATLAAGLANMLPPEICVVEILECVQPLPAVLRLLRELKQQGYTLALDDYVGQETLASLLPLVDIVKVDVSHKNAADIRSLARTLSGHGLTLLAEKVEDLDTLRLCRELHFSLFQGFFFGRVEIVQGKTLPPSQAAKFRLLSHASDEASNFKNVAETVAADVSLSYKLLRYINSVYFGMNKKVSSIRQAIILLGRYKFHQWLCVTILVDMNAAPLSRELACTAAIRGKFLELLVLRDKRLPVAQHVGSSLFLLGLFSMLESILCISLLQVRVALPIEEAIWEALTKGTGPYAPWLDLIRAYERGAWDQVDEISAVLGQHSALIKTSYAEAAVWAAAIFNSAQGPVPDIKFYLRRALPSDISAG